MLLTQMAAPNSPQWFNTGLAWKYAITREAQGHWYVDPADGELKASTDAYSRPQPHACFIQSGAIKSGGTTRRAAKMVCLDMDHPEIESFIRWKSREEAKVAAMVAGSRLLNRARTAAASVPKAVNDLVHDGWGVGWKHLRNKASSRIRSRKWIPASKAKPTPP